MCVPTEPYFGGKFVPRIRQQLLSGAKKEDNLLGFSTVCLTLLVVS